MRRTATQRHATFKMLYYMDKASHLTTSLLETAVPVHTTQAQLVRPDIVCNVPYTVDDSS